MPLLHVYDSNVAVFFLVVACILSFAAAAFVPVFGKLGYSDSNITVALAVSLTLAFTFGALAIKFAFHRPMSRVSRYISGYGMGMASFVAPALVGYGVLEMRVAKPSPSFRRIWLMVTTFSAKSQELWRKEHRDLKVKARPANGVPSTPFWRLCNWRVMSYFAVSILFCVFAVAIQELVTRYPPQDLAVLIETCNTLPPPPFVCTGRVCGSVTLSVQQPDASWSNYTRYVPADPSYPSAGSNYSRNISRQPPSSAAAPLAGTAEVPLPGSKTAFNTTTITTVTYDINTDTDEFTLVHRRATSKRSPYLKAVVAALSPPRRTAALVTTSNVTTTRGNGTLVSTQLTSVNSTVSKGLFANSVSSATLCTYAAPPRRWEAPPWMVASAPWLAWASIAVDQVWYYPALRGAHLGQQAGV